MSYSITQSCVGCQACIRVCPVTAISGDKKAVHTIDPSSCIECGACGRICPHASVLDQNGVMSAMIKRSMWKKPQIDGKTCMSCNMCIEVCPTNCLALSAPHNPKNPHGIPCLYKSNDCIGCGFCAQECPVEAITMTVPA